MAIYVLASATFPYWPDSLRHPLYDVAFRLIGDHLVAPNLGGALGVAGLAGMLPYVVIAFGTFGAAVGRLAGARGLAVCAVVAVAIVAGYGAIRHGGPAADADYRSVRAAVLDL